MNLKIVLSGILGGKSGKDGQGGFYKAETTYNELLEGVIKPNKKYFDEIDIVLHCWNTEQEADILHHYKPTSYKIEKQKKFGVEQASKRRASKLYSMFESFELLKETEPNPRDVVLMTRFDLSYITSLQFEKYQPKINKNKVCFPGTTNESIRLNDLLYFSNYKTLESTLTDEMYDDIYNCMRHKNERVMYINSKGVKRMDNHTIIAEIFKDCSVVSLSDYLAQSDVYPIRKT
tara:strand:+ start:2339 stop:3037 length:699 start_codon:yes stop_codon:yes gene_type:complete